MTSLSREHSQNVIGLHALHKPHPAVGFDVVRHFLDACDGFPLSMISIGATFHGKNVLDYLNAQFCKISKALPSDIQRRLKISYDTLEEEEKDIFLSLWISSIPCYSINLLITILLSSHEMGCNNPLQRSLLHPNPCDQHFNMGHVTIYFLCHFGSMLLLWRWIEIPCS